MRIGIIIGRTGGVDGVALEAEKWQAVLERMGHQVFMLAGEYEGRAPDPAKEDLFPPLSFYGPECAFEQKQAFFGGHSTASEFMARLRENAGAVDEAIVSWSDRRKLDLLIPENGGTLPFHLSMGVGLHWAVERMGLPVAAHHHDFAWERPGRYESVHGVVNDVVAEAFPLRGPTVRHAVINSAARDELQTRFGVNAVVVPNVMDFESPYAERDDFNSTLRRDLRLDKDDILLCQVTRIVRRKGIETAIRLVSALADSRVKLVITGSPTDDPGGVYVEELRQLVAELKIGRQVLFAHRHFANVRSSSEAGNRRYSLSDAYARADGCTFFSNYEGFGNAFVEAVLARRPIFVNNYLPVYERDIAPLGFKTVQLEDNQLTSEAAARIGQILADPTEQRRIAEHNFALGERHFSYATLEEKLAELLTDPSSHKVNE
jgi:mannosylglucosylglycerate synthase